MFNLQELQTIKTNFSNATIIVINMTDILPYVILQKNFYKRSIMELQEEISLEIASIKILPKRSDTL